MVNSYFIVSLSLLGLGNPMLLIRKCGSKLCTPNSELTIGVISHLMEMCLTHLIWCAKVKVQHTITHHILV